MRKIYLDIKYGKGKSVKGFILDISRSGIGIACDKRIGKNTTIEIMTEKNILLPIKGKVISAIYRQRKTYKYRLGIKFISTEREKKERLERLICKIENRKALRLSLT